MNAVRGANAKYLQELEEEKKKKRKAQEEAEAAAEAKKKKDKIDLAMKTWGEKKRWPKEPNQCSWGADNMGKQGVSGSSDPGTKDWQCTDEEQVLQAAWGLPGKDQGEDRGIVPAADEDGQAELMKKKPKEKWRKAQPNAWEVKNWI